MRVFLAGAALALVFFGMGSSMVMMRAAFADQGDIQRLQDQVVQLQSDKSRMSADLSNIHARVSALEGLLLERRMTRLEVLAEANRSILLTIAGAMALQLLETVFRLLSGRGRRNGPLVAPP
jgi:hypothetical protein